MRSFFDDEPEIHTAPVVRKDERKRLSLDKANGIYELFTPDMNRNIEFLYIIIKGGESTNTDLISHEGEECEYVLKGHLLVKVGGNEYYLGEGNSISFDSSIPHRYINIGDRESHSIWAMTRLHFNSIS